MSDESIRIHWFPGHMNKILREISDMQKKVDFVLYVLDSRAPFSCLNPELGKIVENKIAGEKSELLKAMPKPQGGSSSSTITKEQFDKMNYNERVELFNKDPETYNKFK